jgi:hypothetical protein
MGTLCTSPTEYSETRNQPPDLFRRPSFLPVQRKTNGPLSGAALLPGSVGIVRNLPLREPSVPTLKGFRRILQTSGGVSPRIFRMLNEVAIEAIETGAERVTDEALERCKPVGEDEVAFQ